MLLAARAVLAIVFLLAGVAKTSDRHGSQTALENFGVSRGLSEPLSLLLPFAEISLAFMLIAVASAWYGACGALGLLTIFTAAIAVNLWRGRRVDCHCFGELHSAPISGFTVVRTGALALLAGWLAARGPQRMGPSLWSSFLAADDTVRRWYIIAAAAAFFLLLRASRRPVVEQADDAAEPEASVKPLPQKQPRTRPQPEPEPERSFPAGIGLPVGTPAPEFALPSLTGQQRSLQSLREEGKPIFVIFSSPHCEACQKLWPNLGDLLRERAGRLNLVLINRGTAAENLKSLENAPVDFSRVLLQPEFKVAEAYDCAMTPSAVLIGVDGRIRCELAVGGLAIRQLMQQAASAGDPADAK